MCKPLLISENNNFPPGAHVREEAFFIISRGSPPNVPTSHVSQGSTVLKAMRDPSGENAGLSFNDLSRVNCTGSPVGNNFTYTSAGPRKVSGPRRNASIRPSGESAGYTAESVKNVNCSHFPASVRARGLGRKYKNAPSAPSKAN